jgi:hypothetical protein
MYCKDCGNAVNKGLKYCNSCGRKLGTDDDKTGTAKMLDDVLETLFWTAILGLGILVALVAVMLNRDVRPDVIGVVTIAYLVVLFGICLPLARQVPKLIDAKLRDAVPPAWDDAHPQLQPLTTAQLYEHREPASVTEHTTRALEELPIHKS